MHRRVACSRVKLTLCEFLESFAGCATSCSDQCVSGVTFTRVSGAIYVSCALRSRARAARPRGFIWEENHTESRVLLLRPHNFRLDDLIAEGPLCRAPRGEK